MLCRWAVALSAYDYDIKYEAGKRIPQADFLSRYSRQDPPPHKDSLFITPLPFDQNQLIDETKLAYSAILAAVKNGWSNSTRKKFPKLYARKEDMAVSVDGVILINEIPLIPPTLRQQTLNFLHSEHLGPEKMKSLSRCKCFWPTINQDIRIHSSECRRCFIKPNTHNHLHSWPTALRPMQRIHADYCGPFLNKYYALVIVDAFSRFPEVFLTTDISANFTRRAMQKLFARDGIPQVIVTDNGTNFSAESFRSWVKSLGSNILYTAPRHPQSNGLAENFVKTLKIAIKAVAPQTFDDLDKGVDNFLLQYRNASHETTKHTPAFLFKGRNLRTSINLDTTEVLFRRGNDLRMSQGLVIHPLGNSMFQLLDMSDGSVHRRHRDQIRISRHDRPAVMSAEPTVQTTSTNFEIEELPPENVSNFRPEPDCTSTPIRPTSRVSRDGGTDTTQAHLGALDSRPRRRHQKPAYLKDYLE